MSHTRFTESNYTTSSDKNHGSERTLIKTTSFIDERSEFDNYIARQNQVLIEVLLDKHLVLVSWVQIKVSLG